MSSLESSIDRLYQGPLAEFVSARTALAKTLAKTPGGSDDAKRVKALQKPAAVAWAVNQVYWHARPVYDRLIKSGAALRTAQIAALGGRAADLRGAADVHRKALAAAVKEAQRPGGLRRREPESRLRSRRRSRRCRSRRSRARRPGA